MTKPTKTTDKIVDMELPTSKGQVATTSNHSISSTVASAQDTAKAVGSIRANPAVSSFMQRVLASKMQDKVVKDSDLDNPYGRPVPPINANLPAVINTAIAKTNGKFNVKWHQVKNLPGYFQSAIRAMGREVFTPVTRTKIEDINVISSLTNSDMELKLMGTWIKKHGVRNDSMEMKFHDLLPGYQANVDVYAAQGYTFAIVADQFGQYIYGWEETDNKIGHTHTTRMIG